MARDFVPASSQSLSVASGIVSGPPFSFGCWMRADNITTLLGIMSIGVSGALDNQWTIFAAGTAGGDPIRYTVRTTTNLNVDTSAGYSASTWAHVLAVEASTTSHAVYLNGANKGTSSTSKVVTAPTHAAVGARFNTATDVFFDGLLAEAAIWDVALTDADAAMLGLGVSPLLVKPASLVAYWPIIGRFSPEIDLVGRFDLTVTGAAVAAHPRMIYSGLVATSYKATVAGPGGGTTGNLLLLGVG